MKQQNINTRSLRRTGVAGATLLLLLCVAATAFHMPQRSSSIIQFKNRVGKQELKLFDETYTNEFGEPFVISKFRYYISHIVVTDNDNRQTNLPGGYYLVNEEDPLSKTIALPPTAGIAFISFMVGVDSSRSTGGVQTGSLDPMNGMFWTWNSGYVFAKLEGQSDVSPAPAHSFSWDVGGFRARQNAIRQINLRVDKTAVGDTIVINADVLKWFNGSHQLKIAQSPVCHQPGELAMQLADNYSAMFSIAP